MNNIEFKRILEDEKRLYLGDNEKAIKRMKASEHKRYVIWKYLYYFRNCQYWGEIRRNSSLSLFSRLVAKYKYRYYDKKRNIYSSKSGVEIGIHCVIGKNCDIWHSGVIINGSVGENCVFHGNNIIGNKGIGNENEIPVIGDYVDIGAGAIVIGDITVAERCVIGAGAVVTKSFTNPGAVIVGIPGRHLI